MGRILTLDWETTTKTSYKRKANPYDADNFVVIWGLKYGNDPTKVLYMQDLPEDWLDNVSMIVAHNAGFDLSWVWHRKDFREWLKAGGKIWCTQYAEYLLTGQISMWNTLDQCALKYGGVLKNDEIKALWEAGVDTIDIPKDLLCDYAETDVENTKLILEGQIKKARELNMMATIQTHMEALLGLIEMEYNGLYVNREVADKQTKDLEKKLQNAIDQMQRYIPKNLPKELEWNWASKDHLSALLFGGKIKYSKRVPILDTAGNKTYTKKKEDWYLINGEPIHPDDVTDMSLLDTFKGGQKAGKIKTKKVDVQGDLKLRYEDFFFELEGVTKPDPSWETKKEGVYTTNEDTLTILKTRKVDVVENLLLWRKYDKDLGTYYKRYDPKKKVDVGMLTLVQPDEIIHHMLNNVATITGRLSSSNPNLQNIPRGDKSEVKRIFVSRWKDKGMMSEVDFSQLEVIVQGLLSGDKQLIADIREGICFHCKRAATKLGEDYDEVYRKAKVEEDPKYTAIRQESKEFSFQKAYGAGAYSISASTGIPLEDVKAYIKAEDTMYSGVVKFNEDVMSTIKKTRIITNNILEVKGQRFNQGVGYYTAPTGKRYVFREEETPDFMQKPRDKRQKPVYTSFSPTQAKNYAVQGTAGEIVLLCIGKIFREFLKRDNFGGKALMVNTVHDCMWLDAHNDVAEEATRLVQSVFESADKLIEERYGIDCPVIFRAESEIGRNMLELRKLH